MAGSYWWIIGQGVVGESRIWDGISPEPTVTSARQGTPRNRPTYPDLYAVRGLGFLYGAERIFKKTPLTK